MFICSGICLSKSEHKPFCCNTALITKTDSSGNYANRVLNFNACLAKSDFSSS